MLEGKFVRRLGWPIIAGLALVGGALIAFLARPDSRADTLPGTVLQDGSAATAGVEISLQKAVFSATAVDVWVQVTFASAEQRPAGIAPQTAELAGSTAVAAVIADDGLVVLRFPGMRDLAGDVAALKIGSVLAVGGGAVPLEIGGPWNFELRLPPEAERDAVSRLQALEPATVEAGARHFVVEGYRTSSSTVLRYELPPDTIEAGPPPSLKVGAVVLQALRSQREGRQREVWYAESPDDTPIVAVFKGLLVPSDGPGDATLSFELDLEDLPGANVEAAPIPWRRIDATGIEVVSIVRHSDLSGITLRVVVRGLWNPEVGGTPLVIGDGTQLFVQGVGNYPATAGGPQTDVEMRLPEGALPRTLEVRLLGGAMREALAEATFAP